MSFVKNGDATDRQQHDALRGNTRSARHQSVTQFVQRHAAENDAHQAKYAQAGRGILRRGFGAEQENEKE